MKGLDLARLVLGQVCIHASMAGVRMVAPLLALRADLSTWSVGLLLALFSLSQVFLAFPSGRFVDRHGLRRPVGLAVGVAVAGAAIAALFPVFPVLCASALLTGGAAGLVVIALQRHVGRVARDGTDLKRVFGWLSIGPAASNFVGPLLAGLLIDHAGPEAGHLNGYRWAFVAMALLPIVTWLLIRQVPENREALASHSGPRRRAWDLLASPPMRRLMLVNWAMSSAWDVHAFAVPVLGHERGFSASEIGGVLASFAVAAALVRVILPLFADRAREHVVVTIAMVQTALVFSFYPLMHAPLAMGLASVLLGLALGAVQPMIMSTLHQITPAARQGDALALRLMAINASSVVMPIAFGSVGAVIGVSGVFWFVGGAVALGARQAWHLRPGVHAEPASPPKPRQPDEAKP